MIRRLGEVFGTLFLLPLVWVGVLLVLALAETAAAWKGRNL